MKTHKINPNDHFTPTEGGEAYHLRMPAALLVLSDIAVDLTDSTPAGRAKARRVVAECIALFAQAKYPRAQYLETWLMNGKCDARRVLPALVEACEAVGDMAVAEVINGVMNERGKAWPTP